MTIVLTLSSSLQGHNQHMRGVMKCETNQCDLGWWIELAFRLGRERGCGQDVCETRLDANTPKPSKYGLALVSLYEGHYY